MEFKEVYDAKAETLLKYIVSRTKSLTDADDIFQESFLRLYKRMQKGHVETPENLLFTIAENMCIDYYRRLQTREKHMLAYIEKIQKQEPGQESFKVYREVFRVFDGLTVEKQEVAFRLHFFERIPVERVATLLGISRATAFRYVNAVLKEIREGLKDGNS